MQYKIMYWSCSSKSVFGNSEVSDMCFANCIQMQIDLSMGLICLL